jgi:cellulose synthase/poly-beta-1,6-N-acetylglucosamine synthase-like glycosyltransferase
MFFLALTIFILYAIVWWSYFGYYWFLYLLRASDVRRPPTASANTPKIAVMVCTFNEEPMIAEKIKNLARQTYSIEKMHVLIIDGGSTDDTKKLAIDELEAFPSKNFLEAKIPGKINQINYGLAHLPKDITIVVSTDADTLLEPDCVARLIARMHESETTMVVGALCVPNTNFSLEKMYWSSQNLVRLLESEAVGAATVVAPCYAWRREIIEHFPEDVVADDIFVSFAGLLAGGQVHIEKNAVCSENRAPKCTSQFLMHKFRKANAYITEILRFAHFMPKMRNRVKVVFLTRALQLVLICWLNVILMLLVLALTTLGQPLATAFIAVISAISLAITHKLLQRPPREINGTIQNSAPTIAQQLNIFLVVTIVILLSSLMYPFFSQNSSYKRLPSP